MSWGSTRHCVLSRSNFNTDVPMRAIQIFFRSLTAVACAAALCTTATAETRYVSDELEVTLRTGQSTQHQIVRMVKSGTAVEVLATDANTGYTKVRTPSGAEGWVLSRYLMTSPSARQQLDELQRRLATLEIENKQLKEQSGTLKEQNKSAGQQQKGLEDEKLQLEQELANIRKTAGSALALESENKRLKEQYLNLQSELQTVQQENLTLKDRSESEWFVRGAAVVVLGILIGLIAPRLKFRRKSSWDSL